MVTELKSRILNDLTQLLTDTLSPQSIITRFEEIARLLNKDKLLIEQVECKEYYEDGDLSLILLMKNEAIANAQFEQASKFYCIEKELLEEKGNNPFTQLKTEPFFFEYRGNHFLFHFNKRNQNQRLIANLIEGYNLVHPETQSRKEYSSGYLHDKQVSSTPSVY